MKGYLIDPLARTVTEIDHDEEIEDYIGCKTDEIIVISQLMGVGIRDAILASPQTDRSRFKTEGGFMFKGRPEPIIGKALYTGHTLDGEMCDPKLPLDRMRKLMTFFEKD